MPPTLTCAIAENFTHTAAVGPLADYDLLPADTLGVPTPCNVTSGTYRMNLAPAASDFLRASQAAINAAMLAEGSSNTVAFTLSAAGILTITFAAALSSSVTFASGVWQRLGLASNSIDLDANLAIVGTRPVWHLATFAERVSADWQQRTAVASAETAGGVGYGVTSGITRWQDELTFGFIPRDPTFGTSLGVSQTPWEPDAAYLTALGTVGARAYSVSDLLSTVMGKTCAFAAGNFQALRTSTTERYHLVTIPGRECGAPRLARLRAGWDAYRRWTTALIRQSTPTGTRA